MAMKAKKAMKKKRKAAVVKGATVWVTRDDRAEQVFDIWWNRDGLHKDERGTWYGRSCLSTVVCPEGLRTLKHLGVKLRRGGGPVEYTAVFVMAK